MDWPQGAHEPSEMVCRALHCGEGGKVDFYAHQGEEPCAKETFKVVLSLTVIGATVLIALGYKIGLPKIQIQSYPGNLLRFLSL